jgi:type II secretory pathway component PulF
MASFLVPQHLVSSGVQYCKQLRSLEIRLAMKSSPMQWPTLRVKEGRPCRRIDDSKYFHLWLPKITVGKETGAVDNAEQDCRSYEDEVNASVKSLTSILEPIMMMELEDW